MPKEVFGKDYPYLSHGDLLSFEEITRLARVFLAHGVRKIRLTGGEPLLRRHLENLVEQLAGLRTAEGRVPDLTLTTNGSLLARKARALRDAGLARLTVSLDSLQDSVFRRMNDVDFPVAEVLSGIEAAQAAGFERIKVNMVVKRGTNDHEIVPMARHFRGTGITLRFIEYMDVGATNGWRMDEVLPSAQVIDRLRQELPLVQLPPAAPGETAERWGYADAQGRHDPALGRSGNDQQRHPRVLRRLQPRPAVDGRPALPVPLRHAGLGPARAAARRGRRPRSGRGHRRHLAGPHRPLFRTAGQPAAGHRRAGRAARRDELHRRMRRGGPW